jgi:hypothetical protein
MKEKIAIKKLSIGKLLFIFIIVPLKVFFLPDI